MSLYKIKFENYYRAHIQSSSLLKALCTLLPGRPVQIHSNTILTPVGELQQISCLEIHTNVCK